MHSFVLSSLPTIVSTVYADPGGLYPPGLLPLFNHANALLSTGQFNEANGYIQKQ
jgi:DnaJ family protein C protein 3